MEKNKALVTAGVVFLIVAALHLARVMLQLQVTVGKWEIPPAASVGGLIVGAVLGIWMLKAAMEK